MSIQSSLHSINEAEELKSDHSNETKQKISTIPTDQVQSIRTKKKSKRGLSEE